MLILYNFCQFRRGVYITANRVFSRNEYLYVHNHLFLLFEDIVFVSALFSCLVIIVISMSACGFLCLSYVSYTILKLWKSLKKTDRTDDPSNQIQ